MRKLAVFPCTDKVFSVFNVILYQPEIPPNTGNIIRLCANTGARLHLIRPLGFELEDKLLLRAGLDYHEYATLKVHDSLQSCLQSLPVATALPHPPPRESPLSNFPPQNPPHHNPLPQAGEEANEKSNLESLGERANEKGDLESLGEGANKSLRELLNSRRIFAFTTKGSLPYQAARFQAGDAFLFGPESRGLPHDVLESFAPEQRLRLPMLPNNRSLNLSNTVAVAVFEAWRQLEFSGAC